MNQLEYDQLKHSLNPPLVVGEALGRIVTGGKLFGKPMEICPDNRYKDGNIQVVNGKIRGNYRTVRVVRATPPKPNL